MADNTAAYVPPAELGLPMNLGSGWTLDVIQKIEAVTIGEVSYLKYTDGDGTAHYFTKSGSVYYDEDSGLYYLQSRYYDPELCRVLNADSTFDFDADLQGHNLFAYCGNNAVTETENRCQQNVNSN